MSKHCTLVWAVFGLLALALISSVSGSCPNACSGHGSCTLQDSCLCNNGYAGPDCSIVVPPLTPSQPQNDRRLGPREWEFFETIVPPYHQVRWLVTSANGDVDLFLGNDTVPSLEQFIARNITNRPVFELTYNTTGTATRFIVGLFAFSGSPFYSISVSWTTSCNGHGTQVNATHCNCRPPWIGHQCTDILHELVHGGWSRGPIGPNSWKYFRSNVTGALALTWDVGFGKCELGFYAKFGSLPTMASWDVAEDHSVKFNVDLHSPSGGSWFVGIINRKNTPCQTFIQLLQANCDLPFGCSMHGRCSPTTDAKCHCDTGASGNFTGSYCERMVDGLRLGQSVEGVVEDGTGNWYHFTYNTSSQVQARVSSTISTSCVLMALEGEEPSLNNFSFVATGRNPALLLPTSPSTTWYLGVFTSGGNCIYNIATTIPTCNVTRCTNGNCSGDACICNPGWAGPSCDIKVIPITTANVTGQVSEGQWALYSYVPTQPTYLSIFLVEQKGSVGNIWMFASSKRPPTLEDFMFADRESNTNQHHIGISPLDTALTYFIGVTVSPFASEGSGTYHFMMQAWQAPF